VLNDPELLEVFLPLLRADFGLSEMHAYQPEAPLAIPISGYGGERDEHVQPAHLDGWREQTSIGFRRVLFPGGHFFLNEHRAALLSEFARELKAITARLIPA
jgi:surfactin synthase thioesterase subunit